MIFHYLKKKKSTIKKTHKERPKESREFIN
jgi:hypothetical protein